MCKIAVVMSVYNGDLPDNIECSINSILRQTYQSFKLYIMIDGPIKAEIRNILVKYISNPKISIHERDVNKGLAFSLNELIDIAQNMECYAFLARMDSDDISLPQRFSEQIKFFQENSEIDVAGSYCHEFGSEFALNVKKVPLDHNSLIRYTFYKCPFIHPTVMFRMSLFDKGDVRYPLQTSLSEDLALWFILISRGAKLANIDKVLLNYRIDNSTLTRRSGIKKAWSEIKLRFAFAFMMRNKSLKIYLLILCRGIFALCPTQIKKIMYKRCR